MIFSTTIRSSEEPEEPVKTYICEKRLWHQQKAVKRFYDRIFKENENPFDYSQW